MTRGPEPNSPTGDARSDHGGGPDSAGPESAGRRHRRATGTPGLSCELCAGPVLDRHCKIVCLNCGYQRDCSDP